MNKAQDIQFEIRLQLTQTQAEMLIQMVHWGLSSKVNAGWRRPEEWVALVSAVTAALAPARQEFLK